MPTTGDDNSEGIVPKTYSHLTLSQYQSLILRQTEPPNSSSLPFIPSSPGSAQRNSHVETIGAAHAKLEASPNFFSCANCSSPLFPAAAKFASGSGWPSFSSAVPGAVKTKTDWRVTENGKWVLGGRLGVKFRTEAVCAKCGGHLGHIFRGEKWEDVEEEDAGKGVTRYCVNGSSLAIPTGRDEHLASPVSES
ncbi:Thioredoxin [Drechslerella dactyloides]|uniref:Thioredoxin n=1 Tax=Drechslerella dactyloides TaxID=74499 RepID=A0AAD6IWL9_DREDA|nr:Thioredoxin [Drechslerella dactyloides]